MIERDDDEIRDIVDVLREPVRIDPQLDERVMAEIEALPPHRAGGAAASIVAWLRRRRTIRVSPLGGLAAAASLALLLFVGVRLARPDASGDPAGAMLPTEAARSAETEAPTELPQPTEFVLVAPDAGEVAVVGDFNDWDVAATPLVEQDGNGVWFVTLPLEPGRYRYAFVVDRSVWREDPTAPAAEDEFGRPNSVVTIGGA